MNTAEPTPVGVADRDAASESQGKRGLFVRRIDQPLQRAARNAETFRRRILCQFLKIGQTDRLQFIDRDLHGRKGRLEVEEIRQSADSTFFFGARHDIT